MKSKTKWLASLTLSAVMVVLLFQLKIASTQADVRGTLALFVFALSLYIFQPAPLGQLSLLIILMMLATGVATIEVALSGFASEAAFIVLLGIFLNNALVRTSIPSRLVYFMLSRSRSSVGGMVASILMLPVLTAVFIPATVVRATFFIPVVHELLGRVKVTVGSNTAKKKMMALAIGSNISTLVFVTAAPANLIAVEIIRQNLEMDVGYLDWFILMAPIWILMLPVAWVVLMAIYPSEGSATPVPREEIEAERNRLGPWSRDDKYFLCVMTATVALWITEPWHGISLVMPIFLAAVLLSLPSIGMIEWDNIKEMNIDLFFLVGTTVSIAKVLASSGTMDWITQGIEDAVAASFLSQPFLAIFAVTFLSQIFHVLITNVNTAIMIFLPLVIGVSAPLGGEPLLLALCVVASCALGFLLAIESLASTAVLATGAVTQADFLKSGLWLTIAAVVIVTVTGRFWWPKIGLM